MNLPLAPSECCLLHGEEVAGPGHLNDKIALLHRPQEVSARQLAHAILTLVFLENERTGALHFQIREKTGFLGLTRSPALYVENLNQTPLWPAGSLESQLPALISPLQARGKNDTTQIVYELLRHDSEFPWKSVIQLVQEGLAQRNLLQTDQEKTFLGHKVTYRMTDKIAALTATQPLTPYLQILQTHQQARPELHILLLQQIEQGLKRRIEQSTSV